MAVKFETLTGILSAFDNDLLVSASEAEGYPPRVENVPCHLVITQADTPDTSASSGGVTIPVVMYAKMYMAPGTTIKANDYVVAEKHAFDGSLIATYKGKCGVPAVRQSRQEVVFEITSSTPIDPEPTGTFTVDVFYNDSMGSYGWDTGNYTVTVYTADGVDRVQFATGFIEKEDGVYHHPADESSDIKIHSGSCLRKRGTTEEMYLDEDPVYGGELMGWTAAFHWST